MNGHRTYIDPARTSPVRCVERIAPKRGHRSFIAPMGSRRAAVGRIVA